jgi:glutaredoxin
MPKKTVACVYCGEQIDANARACPHCGSDENTGWSENTYLDGIDFVDDDQYKEIREQEFGNNRTTLPVWQIITGIVLLAIIVMMIFTSAW